MNSWLVFAFLPLILSIGVIPALQPDIIPNVEAVKAKGTSLPETGSNKVCGDRLCSEVSDAKMYQKDIMKTSKKGVFPSTMDYTVTPPEIDPEKGYFVTEIADGLYWLIDGNYQMMFLTTGKGVIVVDAPAGMGEKILPAISDVTDEPITHMIYSHIHKDHVGAAHIFPDDTTYIAHIDAANHLKMKNDPDRPIPTITFDDLYTLSLGNQVLELTFEGAFHSIGDIVIYAPEHKVAMVVDLFHPEVGPFFEFGITKNMNEHIAIHDTLLEEYDFDVLVPAHEPILATKDHLKTNKEFTLDVKDNVIQALQTVNYMEIAEQYGSQGQYAVYAGYFDAVAQHCADLTLEKWNDKLRELEPFMIDNCKAMTFYVSID